MLTGLFVADLLLGIMPRPDNALMEKRVRTTENLAIQLMVLMGAKDSALMARTLEHVVNRDPTILSAAIRLENGQIVAQAGAHDRHWLPPSADESTLEHVRVALGPGERKWADLELSFRPAAPQGVWEWLQHHSLALPLLLGVGGFVVFGIYLRRVLQYLDPSAVIPERVRAAFDGFSEGVMVVDKLGRIMLANTVICDWADRPAEQLQGIAAQELPLFQAALQRDPKDYPWMQAMSERQLVKGVHANFPGAKGEQVKTVINCAPIQDSDGTVKGCLVTLNNVTEIELINEKLLVTLDELRHSQIEIERQNQELERLATRDPLTGCLNRRAFYKDLDVLYAQARDGGQQLCCIMTDIDHFKTFNDRYGHAIGDKVLQAVARTLSHGLRSMDLLCRYGGEEFCIMLPGVALEGAGAIAERLRAAIDTRAGSSVRSTHPLNIQASFGVAVFTGDLADPAALIERADQALYAAKAGGRNRVQLWEQPKTEPAKEQPA
jgi:diguanylate cyclase (GGDEF)-like protein